MRTNSIVLLKGNQGYGIWDTVECCFIGFRLNRGAGVVKSLWNKENHAKSAFKNHTGCYFKDQDRYTIKLI